MFIGEAPGDSENILGKPFVGPAGDLLDNLLSDLNMFERLDSIPDMPVPRTTYCITNIISCIPLNENGDTRVPKKGEIEACSPRLVEFIKIVKPKLIVTLGKVAKKNLPDYIIKQGIPIRSIVHPAHLLPGRMDESRRKVAIRRVLFQLNHWLDNIQEGIIK